MSKHKNHYAPQRQLNKRAFSRCLKVQCIVTEHNKAGSMLHTEGPTTVNDPSPTAVWSMAHLTNVVLRVMY